MSSLGKSRGAKLEVEV